jgi:DNA-binding MarR family transcriptional regulator
MSDGHAVAMALRAAYLSMHRQADAFLSSHGLTANQFVLLALLAEQDGVPQRDLVERASSDPNTIRPMIHALEDKGLLVRQQHPDDGRAWLIRLTRKGRRTFDKVDADSEPFRSRLMSALDPGENRQLIQMLERIVTVMKGKVHQGVEQL